MVNVIFDSRTRNKAAYPYATDCDTEFPIFKAQKLKIERCILLNSFYNVRDTVISQDNNDIYVKSGYYSGTELADYLKSSLTDIDISYSYTTFKFTFKYTGVNASTQVDFRGLSKVLGLPNPSGQFMVNVPHTFDIAQLQGTTFYIVEIENLSRLSYGTLQNNTFIIPNNQAIGNVISEELNVEFDIPGRQLSHLRVKLYDEDKNLIHSKIEWMFEGTAQ